MSAARKTDPLRAFPGEQANLPVAAVPDLTEAQVDVVYCAGWDARTRAPVSPMSESVARAQDAAGAQYAVVMFVDGKARAVAEVCWSAHHAELWNVDDAGRRYRGVAYRRWPDNRLKLFEVRSWNYPGSSAPENHGAEPTIQARISRRADAAIDTAEVSAVLGDGSKVQVVRKWPDWPERTRPPENVAVPGIRDWPNLAGILGPVTVRSGPDVIPARFPWRPPRPLAPRYVTELVTAGTRFTGPDGKVLTVERVDAGTVRLPSGRVVVADPGWLDADALPLAEKVPPGKYPVAVFRLKESGGNVACLVRVSGAPVASWHLAMREGDHELELGDGEFFANPVDTATLSIVDAAGVAGYTEDKIIEATADVTSVGYRTISDAQTGTDLVIIPGWTDGAYPVWLGQAEDGSTSCIVLDFQVPGLTPLPAR